MAEILVAFDDSQIQRIGHLRDADVLREVASHEHVSLGPRLRERLRSIADGLDGRSPAEAQLETLSPLSLPDTPRE